MPVMPQTGIIDQVIEMADRAVQLVGAHIAAAAAAAVATLSLSLSLALSAPKGGRHAYGPCTSKTRHRLSWHAKWS